MKVFTSYYARAAKLPASEFVFVRISTSVPDWFPHKCESIPVLYPGWDLVNGIKSDSITKEEYTSIYKDRLKQLRRESIIQELCKISSKHRGKTILLLCYEKPGDFCHRLFVAQWLGIQEYGGNLCRD